MRPKTLSAAVTLNKRQLDVLYGSAEERDRTISKFHSSDFIRTVASRIAATDSETAASELRTFGYAAFEQVQSAKGLTANPNEFFSVLAPEVERFRHLERTLRSIETVLDLLHTPSLNRLQRQMAFRGFTRDRVSPDEFASSTRVVVNDLREYLASLPDLEKDVRVRRVRIVTDRDIELGRAVWVLGSNAEKSFFVVRKQDRKLRDLKPAKSTALPYDKFGIGLKVNDVIDDRESTSDANDSHLDE